MNLFLREIVLNALKEDLGHGDMTSEIIFGDTLQIAQAVFIAKEQLILSGLPVAEMVFNCLDPEIQFKPYFKDGDPIPKDTQILYLQGDLKNLLAGERVALNFIQRLSGIATLTAQFISAVAGTAVKILDTRKTTPGLRQLEKAAVRHGGGHNHRFGLDSGILIKDNHIKAAGAITCSIRQAQKAAPHDMKIEVEVTDLKGLEEAIQAGADIVLLDNMPPELIEEAVRLSNKRVLLEVSGGVNLMTIPPIAKTGVDFISVGALTHSARAVDISMELI